MRRGLSTVIGAVFMIIVIIGALNVTLWMLQQQDRVAQAMMEKTNGNLDRLNEKIEISNIRIDGSKLNMTVTNSGGQPAKLKSLYVVDETAVPKQQYRYDLDIPVDGRNSAQNVGQGVAFTASATSLYSVKVITEAGSTATSVVTPVSAVSLPMSLYVIPPTVTPGQNVTLLYTVTNDHTDSHIGAAVTPQISYSTSCSPGPGCQLTEHASPMSTNIVSGTTALFKWVFEVDAPDNTTLTFNATIADAKPDNYVIEQAYVKLIDEASISTSTTQVIYTSLVQKPEIFLMVPSPFGESNQEGLWGVVVSNPTHVNMTVSRVVVDVFSTKVSASHVMIDSGTNGNCGGRTAIYPSTTSEWTCPHENMIEWKDIANPELIKPFESKSFMVRVVPGSLGANSPEPAFMISVSVFTNMGQYTKTGYSAGMNDVGTSLGNVYLTDTTNAGNAVQSGHILGHMNEIQGGTTVQLNIAMADFDTDTATRVKQGSKLIVNVPPAWEDVTLSSWTGFVDNPTIIHYPADDSHQIIAVLNEDLGDVNTEAKVLSFTAKAPIVSTKKIYVLYALIDGETTHATPFSASGLAEIPLQVVS